MIRIIDLQTGAEITREYTPGELAALNPRPSPLVEIVAMEAEKPFTHRALRELSKTVALMAQAVTGQDPLTNPEVAKIFQLDADIADLRDKAKVQGLI